MQDYDNCIKVSQDILCEHFGINDRDIYKAIIEKVPVKKGEERWEVDIVTYKFK
jgi:Holliday junction resolvase RusA-like endonuclease